MLSTVWPWDLSVRADRARNQLVPRDRRGVCVSLRRRSMK
jgi:hypothetical protein